VNASEGRREREKEIEREFDGAYGELETEVIFVYYCVIF
jgi:hypothetical protein